MYESFKILSQHNDRYFSAMIEANFSELSILLESVKEIETELVRLLELGEHEECDSILCWLEGKHQFPPNTETLARETLENVQNWVPRSRRLLVACTESIAAASHEMTDLGVKRRRRSTSLELSKVRQTLKL